MQNRRSVNAHQIRVRRYVVAFSLAAITYGFHAPFSIAQDDKLTRISKDRNLALCLALDTPCNLEELSKADQSRVQAAEQRRNLNNCLEGRRTCNRQALDGEALSKVDGLEYHRQLSLCLTNTSACQYDRLRPEHVQLVDVIKYSRSFLQCIEGPWNCKPSDLQARERAALRLVEYRRNQLKCATGGSDCKQALLKEMPEGDGAAQAQAPQQDAGATAPDADQSLTYERDRAENIGKELDLVRTELRSVQIRLEQAAASTKQADEALRTSTAQHNVQLEQEQVRTQNALAAYESALAQIGELKSRAAEQVDREARKASDASATADLQRLLDFERSKVHELTLQLAADLDVRSQEREAFEASLRDISQERDQERDQAEKARILLAEGNARSEERSRASWTDLVDLKVKDSKHEADRQRTRAEGAESAAAAAQQTIEGLTRRANAEKSKFAEELKDLKKKLFEQVKLTEQERSQLHKLSGQLAEAHGEIESLRLTPKTQPASSTGTAQVEMQAERNPDLGRTALAAIRSTSSPVEEDRLLTRAVSLIRAGNISAARSVLERALDSGSPRAALMLAGTYDAGVLASWKVQGTQADGEKARELYKRASDGGFRQEQLRGELSR